MEQETLSVEELVEMIHCAKPATHYFWETDDLAHAHESDNGVPCGTKLLSRNRIRGWEVCERCLKHPALKAALATELK